MIGYAVIRHSQYAYGTMTTNEVEKVFETEEQAWEWIEYRYYNTINLNKVRSAILLNDPLRPEGGLNVYGETYVAEFQIHGETYSESFNICKVPMVLNTTIN